MCSSFCVQNGLVKGVFSDIIYGQTTEVIVDELVGMTSFELVVASPTRRCVMCDIVD